MKRFESDIVEIKDENVEYAGRVRIMYVYIYKKRRAGLYGREKLM